MTRSIRKERCEGNAKKTATQQYTEELVLKYTSRNENETEGKCHFSQLN